MSVTTPPRPGRAPARPPSAAGRAGPKHWRMFGVLGVLVAWVAGWALFKGQDTLDLPTFESNSFHKWLNGLNDTISAQRETNFFLRYVIGGISDGLNWLFDTCSELFAEPAFPRPVPEIGWLGVVAIATWIAYAVAGARMAVLTAVTFLAFGFLGYWENSIDLLIVTLIAVGICVLIGLPLAIWMARSKRATAAFTPVLDIMQTTPPFAYLAPLALFFGIGPAAAIVVTLIYALPPVARIAAHGLRSVAPTTVEAAGSLGSTSTQTLRKVQLPMARRTILVGVNQTMMAALSMATIAALVDGPGLGTDVVRALETLDVGAAFVAGLCIVLMAIMLDRVTTAAGVHGDASARARRNVRMRRIVLWSSAAAALACVILSRLYIQVAAFPTSPNLGAPVADWVSRGQQSVVDTFGGLTLGFKNLISFQLLNPLQSILADSPWWLAAAGLLALSFLLGGVRAAVSTLVCVAVILGVGLWHDSMITLSMTLVAAVLVMLLGLVFGVWMGRSPKVDVAIRPFLDALQTIPPFVYIIPALALFGVGRFTAIVAAIAYAAPAAVKIIADGIRGVSPATVEAARSSGSNRWQEIGKVQLPMSRGSTLLAANQGLLFVLSMVVIGGLVGGGGLGFLVVSGFSQLQVFGKGLAAGIAITALGVMLDRITRYTAARYGRAQT